MATAEEFYALDDGSDALSSHLPHGPFVAPGVILLEDEDALCAAIEYVPRDASVMEPNEVMQIANAVAQVIFPFTSGWTLHFEYRRHEAAGYPARCYVNSVSAQIDMERDRRMNGGDLFVPRTFISVTYTPAHVKQDKVARFFIDNPPERQVLDAQRDLVEPFSRMMEQFALMMGRAVGYAKFLDDDEFMTLLANCLDPEWQDYVAAPAGEAMPVKYSLASLGFVPGSFPRLDNGAEDAHWHIAVIGMSGFPASNNPGFMTMLNHRRFPLRYTVRFDCLDHLVARGIFAALWRKHDETAFDWRSVLAKSIGGVEAIRRDTVGVLEAMEADAARLEIEQAGKSAGFMTQDLIVWGRTIKECNDRKAEVVKELRHLGYKPIIEGFHAERAFLGTIPGCVRANKRRVPLPQVTAANFVVLSRPYQGPPKCQHPRLPADALCMLDGPGGTPMWFDPYYGEDGGVFVIGPPRTGKSTWMAWMGHMFLARHPNARVVWLDVDAAESTSMVATMMAGGEYMSFGPGGLSLQPLSEVNTPKGLAWATDVVMDIFRISGVVGVGRMTESEALSYLDAALSLMASESYPAHERTFKHLAVIIQKNELREALSPYCKGKAYGDMVDSDRDEIATTPWLTVDIGNLIDREAAAKPVIRALFRRFYRMFEDGRPTLFMVDEAYKPLADHPDEIEQIRRRGPKKGVSLVVCTHNLEDIEGMKITPMLKGLPYVVALANPAANVESDDTTGSAWERFKFNWAQRDMIANMVPRNEVFVRGPMGSGRGALNLTPAELAVCGCGARDRQDALRLFEQHGRDGFAKAWYRHKGLGYLADELEEAERCDLAAE